jgi:hypothetical protein
MLDFEEWLKPRMEAFWTVTEQHLPPQPQYIVGSLSTSSLLEETVRDALVRIRRCLDLRDTLGPFGIHPSGNFISGDLRYSWMCTRTLHDMGLLINLATTDDSIEAGKGTPAQDLDHQMRKAINWCTLYNLRKYIHEANFNGVDVREAPGIIPMLEQSLRELYLASTQVQRQEQSRVEVLYWLLFTCVWHGQKMTAQRRLNVPRSEAQLEAEKFNARWCNARLAELADILDIEQWPAPRQLLSRFCFSDVIRPHPEVWYDGLIRMNCQGSFN